MRRLMLLAALLLLLSSAYAYDLNACKGDSDWNAIGYCILQGSFSGDYVFFAIIMLAMFAVFCWRVNMPAGASIGIGLVILFALGGFMGATGTMLMNLSVLAIGVMIGLTILHFIRR